MKHDYLLGFDLGSSSVKASLVEADSGRCVASAFSPENEAPIKSLKPGWAEQNPADWWQYAKTALARVMSTAQITAQNIKAIGISYQMHGLVCVDKQGEVLRDAIIWCDSRAVPYGEAAFTKLGADFCLPHLLNSPGNFTAAKLAWVKENEPHIYDRIDKVMLPGDYLAMKLSGEAGTTVSGLSEGIFWDFKKQGVSIDLLNAFGIDAGLLSPVVPTFGIQARVNAAAAAETGLTEGTPIAYRAGDQPNNALSLGVFQPGEIASTAGTSGVVYGVLGEVGYDPKSRVNTFAHVNHTAEQPRLGGLLCINGTGILNAWMRRNVAAPLDYAAMNALAAEAPAGSAGVSIVPFGNGAERVLENKEVGCSVFGLDFNTHTCSHLVRAAQEGIVFSFCYGMEVMRGMGMNISTVHAGRANMFLSPLFREALATTGNAIIELHETDGSVGAAKGAGMGCGIYADEHEAFATLKKLEVIEPSAILQPAYAEAYARWKEHLNDLLARKG